MKKYKIAIIGAKLMGWGGGIDFLIDFIKILERHPEKYTFEVFLPSVHKIEQLVRTILRRKKDSKRIRECLKIECPNVPVVEYRDRLLCGKNRFSEVKKLAIERNVDILMPMDSLMKGINNERYITVAYIYDFQHKYLPELFDPKELKLRDDYFLQMLTSYDFSFTQSYDTKKDIERYFGGVSKDVYVLYAYPHQIEKAGAAGENVFEKCGLHASYFIVCNQFWIHKNHQVVFDALEILYHDGIKDVMVVCTGDTNDYRNPQYFPSLEKHISELDCRDNIKILGYIDKADQVYLLKHSISLIQPTLFEGNPGGGAVVDAMAYGVPCIVSNIPVNLEIPNCFGVDSTSFFEAKDAKSLAAQMKAAIERYRPEEERRSELDYEKFYSEYDRVITDMIGRKKS